MAHRELEWKCIASDPGPDLKLFKARFDHMKNPRNEKIERMIILESADSANVVSITPKREILFVEQYRFGIGSNTIELPGGIVDAGEEALIAAKRELREETGYSAKHWTALGKIPRNPVFMDSYIHHFLAEDIKLEHQLDLDDGELVELITIPVAEVKRKLWDGFFQHPHTVNALLLYFRTLMK